MPQGRCHLSSLILIHQIQTGGSIAFNWGHNEFRFRGISNVLVRVLWFLLERQYEKQQMGVGLWMPGARLPNGDLVGSGVATAICAPLDGLGAARGYEQSAAGVSPAASGQVELA
jgi:hypothetical protein